MANQEHLKILAEGVPAWNEWRDREGWAFPDLAGANLRSADLRGANLAHVLLANADLTDAALTSAGLTKANLTGAILANADLRMVRLREATLVRASLLGADLGGADLKDADCTGADLSGAYFRGTRLTGAIFAEVRLRGTTFAEIDFRAIRDLDKAKHDGPSGIGVDSVYSSQGQIPQSFLRGAGLPENFITFMKSLTGAAFEFYSCFISFSTRDQDFADRLHADLQAKGVRCWFAPHDIQGGRKVHEQIDEAIRVYDKLLLILSEASLNSNWVKTEIANARAREERQKRQMLFPIAIVPFDRIRDWKLFDADRGIDSAREIREYFIRRFFFRRNDLP
jgi:uncharacterized protein YjbI with pentapeptide repeats